MTPRLTITTSDDAPVTIFAVGGCDFCTTRTATGYFGSRHWCGVCPVPDPRAKMTFRPYARLILPD